MKRKGKESKLNVALTVILVTFVCLLSFSIGVISGKGWSDRDYKVRSIESDAHLKQAMEDSEPASAEITAKEVEMLTQKALEEARGTEPEVIVDRNVATADKKEDKKEESSADKKDGETASSHEENADSEVAMASEADPATSKASGTVAKKDERKPDSVPHRPTLPKPTAIEYTVQVASYKTIEEAEAHSQKLIDKGFPAFPVKATVNDQVWYRVSIGSFKNRKQALKYQGDLKKQAMVKNSIVQKVTRK